MARIAGILLPKEKRIEAGLTSIFGVGGSLAVKILKETEINPDTRVGKLTEDEVNRLREYIEKKHKVEGELRRVVSMNVKRLKEINCYRGSRHNKKLPSRGQRTKTNSRTVRGNVRVCVGSGRRPASEKT